MAQQDLEPYKDALTIYRNGGCGFFTAVPSSSPVTCNGDSDGEACISVPVDGVGPYTFIWVGQSSVTNCLNGVDAGTYTVIVIDQGQGASCSWDIIVNEPAPLAVFDMNENPPSCFDACDGTAFPIVIGGNGGNNFAYDSGENTQSANMLCNPFQLTITDSEGCEIDTTFEFINAPDSIEISAIVTDNTCAGIDDGSIDVSIVGGVPLHSFAWTGPNSFTSADEDISGLEPGDYTVEVTDDNGCQNSATFTILPATEILVLASITDVICAGDSTGSIEIDVSGGNPGYSFDWTGPDGFVSADEDIFNLPTGTYDLTITDLSLCTKDTSFFVSENLPITMTATVVDVDCFGESTGSIDVTVTGSFPILTYSWTGDITSADEDLTDIPAGNYTLTVTDDQGCSIDSTFEITSPDEILLDLAITDILCAGDSTGAIDLEVTGGVVDYSYAWSGPDGYTAITQDILDLPAGDFTVNVTDMNLCEKDSTVTVSEPTPIVVTDSIVPVACAGDSTGAVYISITGGTGAYAITWTGPNGYTSADEDILDLAAGIYDLSILDDNLCEFTASYEVTTPDSILVDATLTHLDCFGDSNGAIDITATGGVGALHYTWGGPGAFSSNDEDIADLIAGLYTLSISDDNSCTLDTVFEILSPDEIVLTLDITHILCFDEETGSVDVTATGGTGALQFDWTGPNGFTSILEDIADLEMGDYTLTVTDDNDCTVDTTITINEPTEISVSETITHILCTGDGTGSIEIDISGGTAGYLTQWTGPNGYSSNDEDIFGLVAGIYDLTVTDANLCEFNVSYEVLEPDSLMIDFLSTDVLCNGDSTGVIDITVTGGILQYTYAWTGPGGFVSADEDIADLPAGDYTILVTDDNLCTAQLLIPITEPDAIAIDTTVTHLSCFGDANGSILLDISGGQAGYQVSWTGPGGYTSNDEDIFDLLAGIYIASILDANDCPASISVEIIEPGAIVVDGTLTHVDCFGQATGAIDLTVSNGVAGYTFDWTGPNGYTNDIEDIAGLEAGIYDVLVTDANLCTQAESYEILSNDSIEILGTDVANLCAGDDQGSIDIEVTGGFGDYTYSWTGPNGFTSMDQDITGLETGTYIVIVTDDLACQQTGSFEITEPQPLAVDATLIDPNCFGDSDGDIDILISGGTPDYFIEWIGPVGFNQSGIGIDIADLIGGEYFLTITDDSGCTLDTSFTLTNPNDLLATLDISDPNCGMDDGAVTSIVTGGTVAGDYTYSWLNSVPTEIGTDDNISGQGAGTYVFIVSDDNNCSVTIPFQLSDDIGTIQAQVTDVTCFGDMDGAIDVEVTGLTGNLIVSWTGPGGITDNQLDISGLAAGDYFVSVEDEIGCTLVENYTVDSPDEITVTADIIHEACPGTIDGAIDITAVGGSGDLTYSWSSLGGFTSLDEDISGLEPDTYTVLITDTSSCTGTADFVVDPAETYVLSADITPVLCAGDFTGEIDLTVAPALIGATFAWTGPNGYLSDQEDLTGLESGTYDVTVTTANFCILSDTYVVTQPDSILVTLDITNSACGMGIGAVSATVTGGQVALDYQYSYYTLPDNTPVGDTGLDGGLYGYTITDDNNCSVSGSFAISDEIGTLTADIQGVTCVGAADGAIDITVTGLTGNLTIIWSGPNGFTSNQEDISSLEPGFYTVSITDENGCVLGDTYEIVDGAGIAISAILSHVSCFGFGDGAIDMSFVGGNGLIDILWNGPDGYTAMTEDITGLDPGVYGVTVSDADGCQGNESYEILEPDTIAVQAIITPVLCNGDATGAIDITITGGTGQILISWTGPGGFTSSFEDLSGLDAGIYSLSLADDNGCAFDMDYEVTESDPIALTVLQQQNSSCNQATGLIEVDASGGNGPYTYEWTNSGGFVVSGIALAEDLPADTYTVTVVDEEDCEITQDYIISDQDAQLDAVITHVSCNGFSDGAIDLTVTGDVTAPADTLWTGPNGFTASTEDITGLEAGFYTVEITDAATCVFSMTWEVTEPDTILVTGTAVPVTCNGSTDGSIDIEVNGGTGIPTYAWIGPNGFTSDQEDITGLEPGLYTVTVSDAVPCVVVYDFEVLEPSAITVLETLTDPSCVGVDDGSILIDVAGGNGGYSFAWTGPDGFNSNAEDILNLTPGVYDLTVTDDSMCVGSFSFELIGVQLIDFEALTSEILCTGDSVATIDITVTGGNGGFTYDWTGPNSFTSDQEDLTDLFAGTYDVLVSDVFGCELDTFVVLNEPEALDIALIDLQSVTCPGEMDGAITILTSGGTLNYTFAWTGPSSFTSNQESISALEQGTYNLTVTDGNLCELEVEYEVAAPDSILIQSSVEPVNCNGDADGRIEILPSGGTGVYNFSWTGPGGFTSDQEDLDNLEPGTYDLTITDTTPCSVSFSFEITEPDAITIAETVTDPSCVGINDGSIEIDVAGGNGGYDFNWTGPGFNSSLEDISGLQPGTYDISIVDDSSCTATGSYTLQENQVLLIDLQITEILCNGDLGSIDLTPSGGGGGFTTDWTGPNGFTSPDEDISDLEAGDYLLQMTDQDGCEIDSTISLVEPSLLNISLVSSEDVTCIGDGDGALSVQIGGGTPILTLGWTGPGGYTSDQQSIAGLEAGEYTVTLTDANSCDTVMTYQVNEPDSLLITLNQVTEPECENTADGAIDITVTGGNGGTTFDWIGPNGYDSMDEDISGLMAGNYIINATDVEGCIATEMLSLNFQTAISAEAGTYPPVCNGDTLQLAGIAGPTGSLIAWSVPGGPDFSTDSITTVNISSTNHTFVLTATNGNCIATDTAFIEVLSLPLPDAGEDVVVFFDEVVTLGGDPVWVDAQSYSWEPSDPLEGADTEHPTYLVTGPQLFTVSVVGLNGCIGEDDVLVDVNPELVVPGGFTPNGDQWNNTWRFDNNLLFPDMLVRVFNRWGDELWTSKPGYTEEWDGMYDGKDLPVGTYYYVIELNDERFPDPLTGPVTIFR